MPEVKTVLLRRTGVWVDLYPGDSDLDVTIVMRDFPEGTWPSLFRVYKVGKILKKIFPPLGELWVIPGHAFPSHKTGFWFDYSDPHSSDPSVAWRLGQLIHNQQWNGLINPPKIVGKIFFRHGKKIAIKSHHFFEVMRGKDHAPVIYPQFSNREIWLDQAPSSSIAIRSIFEEIVFNCESIPILNDFEFNSVGKPTFEKHASLFKEISDQVAPCIEEFFTDFGNIWICRSTDCWEDIKIFFELTNPKALFDHPRYFEFITKLSQILNQWSQFLAPTKCFFGTSKVLHFLQFGDPLFGALFKKERYDVIQRKIIFEPNVTHLTNAAILKAEIQNLHTLIFLLPRIGSNDFAKELFDFRWPVLKKLFNEKVLDLDLFPNISGDTSKTPFNGLSWENHFLKIEPEIRQMLTSPIHYEV